MQINGVVHCLFEQSGTFKNEFKKLGYEAYDYDIQNNFILKPAVWDKDRSLRGDYFKKPTGFWYVNCEPTYGKSYQPNEHPKIVWDCKSSSKAGICSEERSLISPDYARNFICDFIIGKEQNIGQLRLL